MTQAEADVPLQGDHERSSKSVERIGKELLAGGVAGTFGKSSVAPMERVKILIQTGSAPSDNLGTVLRYMYKTDGVRGFFKGNGASVARIVPYAALHFSAYEQYRAVLVNSLHGYLPADTSRNCNHSSSTRPPVWIDLLAGSLSGATAVMVTYPLDLVRTRLAIELEGTIGHRPTIYRTICQIVSKDGIVGLYRGLAPTIMGILPYSGIKFYVYQKLKRAWTDARPASTGKKLRMYESLVFGAVSGVLAQTISYPLDMVRRRMQVSSFSGKVQHESMLSTLQDIVAQHGWRGLFQGAYINYIKVAPATAVGFAVYDIMKDLLDLDCQW